jgi:sec-independent protein translocase protein TatA
MIAQLGNCVIISRRGAAPGNSGRSALVFMIDKVLQCERKTKMFEGLFQPMHLLVIFGIALLVFGPKKLPELGKGIGESIRGFKSAMKEREDPPEKSTSA